MNNIVWYDVGCHHANIYEEPRPEGKWVKWDDVKGYIPVYPEGSNDATKRED